MHLGFTTAFQTQPKATEDLCVGFPMRLRKKRRLAFASSINVRQHARKGVVIARTPHKSIMITVCLIGTTNRGHAFCGLRFLSIIWTNINNERCVGGTPQHFPFKLLQLHRDLMYAALQWHFMTDGVQVVNLKTCELRALYPGGPTTHAPVHP